MNIIISPQNYNIFDILSKKKGGFSFYHGSSSKNYFTHSIQNYELNFYRAMFLNEIPSDIQWKIIGFADVEIDGIRYKKSFEGTCILIKER